MQPASSHPPYTLQTERLRLRCFELEDAGPLADLMARNKEHLVPWMSWAHDLPLPISKVVELLRAFRSGFDRGDDFNFAIFDREDGVMIGGFGMHPRCGPGGLEIGYWISHDRARRGYATEAAGAATRAGIELLGAARIEIHIHPENAVSEKVPERLGFEREGVLKKRLRWHDGTWRDQVIWTLFAEDLAGSWAGTIPYQAFDAVGRPLSRGNTA